MKTQHLKSLDPAKTALPSKRELCSNTILPQKIKKISNNKILYLKELEKKKNNKAQI